ncbi:hypothetical protein F4811DRAFT_526927, partial [Daldinia bambusicola]
MWTVSTLVSSLVWVAVCNSVLISCFVSVSSSVFVRSFSSIFVTGIVTWTVSLTVCGGNVTDSFLTSVFV